ncbi:MAG: hypothetical protein U0Q15_02820 [Kineosporiaceae bacterium]
MRSQPLFVDEVDGPIVVSSSRRGRFGLQFVIEVDGEAAERNGPDRWLLPGVDGTPQPAVLRGKPWDVFPTLAVAGQEVRVGPTMPWWLIALALLPAILCAPFKAPFGLTSFVIGVVALLVNQLALREAPTMGQRAIRVVSQDVIAVMFWLMLELPRR